MAALVRAAALVSLAAALSGVADAQEPVYTEAEIKAAHLYHFATYVQWPDEGDAPIVIAVLRAPSVATQLEAFLSREPDRRIRDRSVVVRRLEDLDDLDIEHHVLFVGTGFDERLDDVLAALDSRPVLVVTDADNALARGAMVNFQIVGQNVRFEISLRNAENAGLMLSSRLLAAAIHVETSNLWIGTQPLAPMLAQRARQCGLACQATFDQRGRGRNAHNARAEAGLSSQPD